MTELRTDPILDRWVLLASKRDQRPNDFVGRQTADLSLPASRESCPFCPGNEQQTPTALYEACDRRGNWRVRVVPNKFPAVGLKAGEGACGAHEVIIESPRHVQFAGQLNEKEMIAVVEAYRARLQDLRRQGSWGYAMLFKNAGAAAGASLVHLHSQLLATQAAPPLVLRELQSVDDYRRKNACCVFCARCAEEQEEQRRLVLAGEGYVAFCPYASLQPFETWIMPVRHQPSFELIAEPAPLARILREVYRRVEQATSAVGYNMFLRTAPWESPSAAAYHWRIEIHPRPTPMAGLELGSGIHINHVSPENAAQRLKSVQPEI